MKKVFAILGIIILLLAAYIWWVFNKGGKKRDKGPEPVALAVSKHSPAFNQSVQQVIDAYYRMTEAFVNWDEPEVTQHATTLKSALDSLKIEELKIDTTGIYESALDPLASAKNQAATIISAPSIDEKRAALNNLSENLRLLFIVVKYDQGKLYWQECPMALGEDQPAYWLSQTDAVRNPYLGTKHPKYKATMLTCGEPKDTINFMQPDTAQQSGG